MLWVKLFVLALMAWGYAVTVRCLIAAGDVTGASEVSVLVVGALAQVGFVAALLFLGCSAWGASHAMVAGRSFRAGAEPDHMALLVLLLLLGPNVLLVLSERNP